MRLSFIVLSDAYEVPEVSLLLTIASFIYLINIAEAVSSRLVNAGLIGSLLVGIVFRPQVCNLLSDSIQDALVILGYIGLVLIVFEGGLSTNIQLLYHNLFLSAAVAFTGIALPIGISFPLLSSGYGYPPLQAFCAGAALCSTSQGTAIALLRPEMRQTRTGTVLLSAALLDDIVGLVIAAIIPQIPFGGSTSGTRIAWYTIARPILVSFAFGLGTPILASVFRPLFLHGPPSLRVRMSTKSVQLFLIVSLLSGFVAAAKYAGTSELFGSDLAGAFLTHVFSSPEHDLGPCTPTTAFALYLPALQTIFSPIFFASVGSTLPIRSLFLVGGSRRVIWHGIIYALLMVIAKALAGLWMLIPSQKSARLSHRSPLEHRSSPNRGHDLSEELQEREAMHLNTVACRDSDKMPRTHSAALVGLALVARGEIALIVAQLAKPVLLGDATSERLSYGPFWLVPLVVQPGLGSSCRSGIGNK